MSRERIHFYLPQRQIKLLRAEAESKDLGLSELIRRILDDHFNNEGGSNESSTNKERVGEILEQSEHPKSR